MSSFMEHIHRDGTPAPDPRPLEHVNYPHEPGRLFDCPACEARCHCDDNPGTTECVYSGRHRFDRGFLSEMGEWINGLEFGTVFDVTPAGDVEGHPGLYAPEVYNSDTDDVEIADMAGERWEALTGMTGQYAYNGAVMHSSEFIGDQIARKLMGLAQDETQTFVVTTVEDIDDDEREGIAGWCILHFRPDTEE